MNTNGRTFVGFGFGPIQSALFLLEAFKSGNFSRYVVAEVDSALVAAVRENGGCYSVNIAHSDRIEQVKVDHVELYNPDSAEDREKIVEAVAHADELATALPSVKFFSIGGDAAVTAVMAEGLRRRDPARPGVLYAAENHNHAAEILGDALAALVPAGRIANLQLLNTVIGKMSGVIMDPPTINRMRLATLTPTGPGASRAVLVEAFNRILVSQVRLNGFARGITVFAEKPDLLAFEEAKLYGHNAIHALIGYLAAMRNLATMAEAARHPDILAIARHAFLYESGAALVSKYQRLGDSLFSPAGWRAYADDLLTRMVNPNLNDLVDRVIRDPVRKLGWDDRLFGTMRLARSQHFSPRQMAFGAAAALVHHLGTRSIAHDRIAQVLCEIWGPVPADQAAAAIELTASALRQL